jgi:cytosine/adenosine deaminase-related metal-dependent hydrolase
MRLFSTLVAAPGLAVASSILFRGGTIIAFDNATESLKVIRGGSVLVTDDRITKVSDAAISVSKGTEVVDITGKILAPGQINTHFHGWQTAFKTLGSNTSLVEYFNRYGEYAGTRFVSKDNELSADSPSRGSA